MSDLGIELGVPSTLRRFYGAQIQWDWTYVYMVSAYCEELLNTWVSCITWTWAGMMGTKPRSPMSGSFVSF